MRTTNDILRDFAEQLINSPFIDGSKSIGEVLLKILDVDEVQALLDVADEEKEKNDNAIKSRLKK